MYITDASSAPDTKKALARRAEQAKRGELQDGWDYNDQYDSIESRMILLNPE